jgi:glyoxylate reductase
MPRPLAVLAMNVPQATLDRVRQDCDVRIIPPPVDRQILAEALASADGLLGSAVYPIDTALMDAAPRLRVLSNFGVGFNNVDVGEATRRGIAVCNTPGVLTDAVANLTLGLILSTSRRLPENFEHGKHGWAAGVPGVPLGFDIRGKTLGIVGYGRIGRAVALRARAFGMKVVYYDSAHVMPEAGDRPSPLDDLLRQSDIVSIHANLTPETHHLISDRELALMKPTSWLVNTARGPVVDQAALVRALNGSVIAGAALDVLEIEPPPPGDPILSAPNVRILPHIGSATVETRAAMLEMAVQNLLAVLARERPPSCVNPEVLG